MKNKFSAIVVNDSPDMYHYVSDLVRDGLNLGLETLSGLWNGNERRNAPRVRCNLPCVVDLGFPEPSVCQAEVVDISMSGCLMRVPAYPDPSEHINEIGELCLAADDADALKLYGTIVRVEADRACQDGALVLVGFCFTALGETSRERLSECIDACERNLRKRPALV
jgi:hypothetical protein